MHLVRLATETDLPAIVEISNDAARLTHANFATEPETLEAWREAWHATSERHPWYVAAADGAVVAFAKSSPHRPRGAYAWSAEVTIYIRPDQQGRGLGRTLYGRLIPTLARQGYRVLLAGIATPNPASVRLHESFGFRHAGTFARVGWKLERWCDVGYWQLVLDESESPPAPIRTVDEVT